MRAREMVVGTRGSALALAQTELVCAALRRLEPGLAVRVQRITTTGDVRTDVPLSQLERGMFVTEIESALRDGRIDIAVHSAKDLPSTAAPDLDIAAFLPREDARDVLIARDGATTLQALPAGARVGTSSPRRASQLRALRPDIDARDVRGNVDTRLRKLRAGEFDALILAAAGLIRLGRASKITEWLDPELFIPCVGQGALAIEARMTDDAARDIVGQLDDADTRAAVLAERAFLAELGAGCRAAVAAHARVERAAGGGVTLHIAAMIGSTDGAHVRASRGNVRVDAARELGTSIARELLRGGGAHFLAARNEALRGAKVVVTRPAEQAVELLELLRASGAEAVCCPAIAIAPTEDVASLDAALALPGDTAWIVFTSANAVRAVADRLDALGARIPEHVRIAAVGGSTAEAARERLGRVDFMPARSTAQALAESLPEVEGRQIVFPRGDLAMDTVPATLRARGAGVRDVVAYRTVAGDGVDALSARVLAGDVDAIVFTSPSGVRFVSDALRAAGIPGNQLPLAVTVGPTTSHAARAAHWPAVAEAATASVGAMVDALERALARRKPAAHTALSRT